ncbi:hypothetical protein [Nocardioides speluncae]|uniref:hypothetical protein n=1 Tax=Nocardioides speluncae TaxID=2670337 RepID=UPI000D685E45|nr:hypothetical protein [Nocardioides speluncae]
MGLLDRITGANRLVESTHQITEQLHTQSVSEELGQANDTIELLQESMAELELALEDQDWRRMAAYAEQEFTRVGLHRISVLARIMSVANPLVKRGLSLRTGYVWGGGVSIAARAVGDDGDQDVNAVVQGFLDDPANRKVLTGPGARERNERTLGTDGNLLFACFTERLSGGVQVRPLPFDQVTDVLCNPQDASEAWYYKREYVEDGQTLTTYYPDIAYRPRGARPVRVNGVPVMWDAPVIHLKVNDLQGWKFGLGDAYAVLPWARAYKDFLTDWALLTKSLAKFAWRATGDTKSRASRAVTAIKGAAEALRAPLTSEPAGQVAAMGPGHSLEAIPKSGATIDAESGKPLAGMVAAGLDVPVTMLLTDPGTTGARAVAETLDQPTENMARMRRDVHQDFLTQLLGYVIDQAVIAPAGPLKGTVGWDPWGRQQITLASDTDRTVDFTWPDLTEDSVLERVSAIVDADSTAKMPATTTMRLLLEVLGVRDVDELIEENTDAEGNWVDPNADAGDEAVRSHRRGEDPAALVR